MTFKSKVTQQAEKAIEKRIEKLKEKEDKPMKKINWETIKTIVIVMLVTGIVAFIGGMKYQERHSSQVRTEAAAIVKNVQVRVEPLK